MVCKLASMTLRSAETGSATAAECSLFPGLGADSPLMLAAFFFQAEDVIRDPLVTGVQTCALPISQSAKPPLPERALAASQVLHPDTLAWARGSEERRVGKSVNLGGRRIIKKK